MSSSSQSPASPEPEVQAAPRKMKGRKSKTSATTTEQAKNEGSNPNWHYEPPADAVLLDHGVDSGEFDWDAVNDDDDCELWVIRIPDGIKPKYLENLQLEIPPSNQSIKVGSLSRKHTSYDIWAVGEGDDQPVVGEEIRHLQCLLPRKSKSGKLYQAPKPISRHLVFSAQPTMPTSDPRLNSDAVDSQLAIYQNPLRQSYPKQLLKHCFIPYGSLVGYSNPTPDDSAMDIDYKANNTLPSAQSEILEVSDDSPKKAKVKKRRGESDTTTPKRSKKAKTGHNI